MDPRKIFKNFLLCSAVSFVVFGVFIFSKTRLIHAANTSRHYSLPSLKPGFHHKVKVHLMVKDGKDIDTARVIYVIFNGKEIPLKKGSPLRANYHTSLKPGTYPIEWSLLKAKTGFTREANFHKRVKIKEGTPWVEIKIEGDELSIN